MPSASPFIGIDFGTSKCAMAWYNPEARQAEPIHSDGREEVPSIVYIGNLNDIRVGQPAEILLDDVANEIRHGTSESNMIDLYRFFISIKRNLVVETPRIIDGRPYHPEFIVSKILEKLRKDAESGHFMPTAHFPHPVSRAVITHPATSNFDKTEKDRIREAGKLAGFSTIEFLPEPEAAAIAYAHSGLEIGQCVLVYDFGGGTFDVAVLRRESAESFQQVIPSRGDDKCGGDYIDRILYDYFDKLAQQRMGLSFSRNGQLNPGILRLCRRCKENLSRFPNPQPFSAYIREGNSPIRFEDEIDRSVFEKLIRPTIARTVDLTQEAMREAQRRDFHVDTVVLVGGSSNLPLVSTLLEDALQIKTRVWNRQHIAVALGAGYYAEQRWGSAFAEYRQAVQNVWEPARRLAEAQSQELGKMANTKQLDNNEAANIEHAVIGNTKEEVLQRQYRQSCTLYRVAVKMVQNGILQSNSFPRPQLDNLTAREKELGISERDAETIEREELRDTKVKVWEYFHEAARTQYRRLVAGIKPVRFPSQEQIKTLENKSKELALSKEDATTIEREELGDTKENYYTRLHQEACTQYRDQVNNAWENNFLTPDQVNMLNERAENFHLSNNEAQNLEIEVMRHRKETILKLQEYRKLVQDAWRAGSLTQEQANTLDTKIKELGIRQEDAAKIEREVMGHTKETILKLQEYRVAVKRAWSNNLLTLSQLNVLKAKRKELGISDNLAESIERQEMGDTAINIAERRHQESLKRYRESVQKVKEQVDILNNQAKALDLSRDETSTIHRELMPSLLPHPPIRSDKIFPCIVLVVSVALAGGFIGFGISNISAIWGAVIFAIVAMLSFVWLVYRPKPNSSASSRSTSQSTFTQASAPQQQQKQQK